MFSLDVREKQMRDLKAKPAVSTLKTVHTNYFPEGVSTLFPLCCQHSHRFNCRRAFAHPLLGNAQHPISILICRHSIIPSLSSIQMQNMTPFKVCTVYIALLQRCSLQTLIRSSVTAGIRWHPASNNSNWCVYLADVLRFIITHHCHALSSLPFLPFCFWPHLLACPPLFSISVHSSLHQSCTHCCSLCLCYLSSHFSHSPPLPPLLSIQITLLHFSTPPPSGFPRVFSFSFYPFLPVCPFFHPFPLKCDGPKRWQADSSVMCIRWESCHPTLFCQSCNKLPLLLLIHGLNFQKVKYITLTIKTHFEWYSRDVHVGVTHSWSLLFCLQAW